MKIQDKDQESCSIDTFVNVDTSRPTYLPTYTTYITYLR